MRFRSTATALFAALAAPAFAQEATSDAPREGAAGTTASAAGSGAGEDRAPTDPTGVTIE